MAHITGGGIPGNVNRALPDDLDAVVETASWMVPNEFRVLQRAGQVSEEEMYRVFNMGVGMVVIIEPASSETILASARSAGVEAWRLGRTIPGSGRVILA